MVQRKLSVSGLLLILGFCLPGAEAETHSEIPFKLYDGFAVVVQGAIGNHEKLNFLVDTGAVPSVIHQRLKRKLKLNGVPEDNRAVNQTMSVERVDLPDLRLGPLEVQHPSVVAVDLTPIEVRLGVSLDAVIGLDLLGRQDFTIDFTEHKIRLGAPSVNGQAITFELRTQAGAPYVVIPIQVNSHPLWVLFDTGTDGLTLFESSAEPRLPTLKKAGTALAVTTRGANTIQLVEVSILRFGTREWGKVQASVVAAPSVREFDGMLGPASLRVKRMAFSFASNTLYLEFSR